MVAYYWDTIWTKLPLWHEREIFEKFHFIFTCSLYSIMLQKLKKVLKAYLEMQVCVILGLKLRKIAHLAQNIIILEILLK